MQSYRPLAAGCGVGDSIKNLGCSTGWLIEPERNPGDPNRPSDWCSPRAHTVGTVSHASGSRRRQRIGSSLRLRPVGCVKPGRWNTRTLVPMTKLSMAGRAISVCPAPTHRDMS